MSTKRTLAGIGISIIEGAMNGVVVDVLHMPQQNLTCLEAICDCLAIDVAQSDDEKLKALYLIYTGQV